MDAMLSTYNESGQAKASPFRFPQLLKTTVLIHRLVRKARGELKKPFQERVEKALEGVEEAAVPDGQLLEKFYGPPKDLLRHLPRILRRGLSIGSLQEWELRPYSLASVGGLPPRCPSLFSPSIPPE